MKIISSPESSVWVLLRVILGWLYLWAFFDKTFGLGFATAAENAWLAGGSPTFGFLTYATKGPFAELFQSLAGSQVVDMLFMLGILFVGVSLVSGVAVRLGALTGATFSILFYVAGFMPPEHNPVVDEHIVYLILFLYLVYAAPSSQYDLSQWWRRLPIVRDDTRLY